MRVKCVFAYLCACEGGWVGCIPNMYIGVYLCEYKGVFEYVTLCRWVEKSFLLLLLFFLFYNWQNNNLEICLKSQLSKDFKLRRESRKRKKEIIDRHRDRDRSCNDLLESNKNRNKLLT